MTIDKPDEQTDILEAIDAVIALCDAAQADTPDPVVMAEKEALCRIRSEVARQWPRSDAFRAAITIGPVAAKNIADWNAPLADALMKLDHRLRHAT